MRRVENEEKISVKIVRFGADTVTLSLEEDASVSDALAAAGLTSTPAESVWVNGEQATANDILEDGDTMQIVGKKEGGSR